MNMLVIAALLVILLAIVGALSLVTIMLELFREQDGGTDDTGLQG